MLYFGFPMLSTYIALVLSSIAAANAEGSELSTNLMPISNRLRNTVHVVRSHNPLGRHAVDEHAITFKLVVGLFKTSERIRSSGRPTTRLRH